MGKSSDRATDRIVLRNIVLTVLLATGGAAVVATSCLGSGRMARDDGSASGITETVAGVPSPTPGPAQAPLATPSTQSVQSSAGGVSTDTRLTGADLPPPANPPLAAPPAPPLPTIDPRANPGTTVNVVVPQPAPPAMTVTTTVETAPSDAGAMTTTTTTNVNAGDAGSAQPRQAQQQQSPQSGSPFGTIPGTVGTARPAGVVGGPPAGVVDASTP